MSEKPAESKKNRLDKLTQESEEGQHQPVYLRKKQYSPETGPPKLAALLRVLYSGRASRSLGLTLTLSRTCARAALLFAKQ